MNGDQQAIAVADSLGCNRQRQQQRHLSTAYLPCIPPISLTSPTTHTSVDMARYHDTPGRASAKRIDYSQKYSLYLPLHPTSERKGSVSKSDAAAKREREMTASRASVDPGRRRATMRSKEHDDEEEQLQRALEESKKENAGRRNGKRARDDGEE